MFGNIRNKFAGKGEVITPMEDLGFTTKLVESDIEPLDETEPDTPKVVKARKNLAQAMAIHNISITKTPRIDGIFARGRK
jgi:hypothetical protein